RGAVEPSRDRVRARGPGALLHALNLRRPVSCQRTRWSRAIQLPERGDGSWHRFPRVTAAHSKRLSTRPAAGSLGEGREPRKAAVKDSTSLVTKPETPTGLGRSRCADSATTQSSSLQRMILPGRQSRWSRRDFLRLSNVAAGLKQFCVISESHRPWR